MSGTLMEAPAIARARLLRGFITALACKIGGVVLLDFILLRVLGPNLVNRHQDLALIGALICVALALAFTLWLAFQIWIDTRRFRAANHAISRIPTLKVESR